MSFLTRLNRLKKEGEERAAQSDIARAMDTDDLPWIEKQRRMLEDFDGTVAGADVARAISQNKHYCEYVGHVMQRYDASHNDRRTAVTRKGEPRHPKVPPDTGGPDPPEYKKAVDKWRRKMFKIYGDRSRKEKAKKASELAARMKK